MLRIEDHKIFKALKYGLDHSEFSQEEISKAVGLTTEADWSSFRSAVNLVDRNNDLYTLEYEAIINYLEIIQLQEARQSSKDSLRVATNSVRLVVVAMVISAGLAITNLAVALGFWG